MATLGNIAGPSEDGTTLGATTSQKVGMHGSVADQAAHIADVTTTLTLLTSTAPGYGWSTSTLAATEMGKINSILAALEEKGILASA